jgi:glycosyltransferase involved in cell wall biosynthesis
VFPGLVGRSLWAAKTWLARRTAAGFTTVSQAAREEIVEYMGLPRDRIHVVLEAADPVFRPVADPGDRRAARERAGLPPEARLLLYVGGLAPHKNLLRLVEAYARALQDPRLADLHLVFVGDPQGDGFLSNYEALRARVEGDPTLAGRVHFTGFVADADLAALYSDALAVAMPALSEGFGLPAAEAIACGTPVIATRGGAVAEVVGAAGMFFDPLDVDQMAQTIVAAASDPARYAALKRACAPRAAELSWSAAAAGTLDVLERFGRAG